MLENILFLVFAGLFFSGGALANQKYRRRFPNRLRDRQRLGKYLIESALGLAGGFLLIVVILGIDVGFNLFNGNGNIYLMTVAFPISFFWIYYGQMLFDVIYEWIARFFVTRKF